MPNFDTSADYVCSHHDCGTYDSCPHHVCSHHYSCPHHDCGTYDSRPHHHVISDLHHNGNTDLYSNLHASTNVLHVHCHTNNDPASQFP